MRGQKSRSGPGVRPGFEGGQTPMHRRFPKLKGIAGGMGAGKAKYVTVNVDDISAAFAATHAPLRVLELRHNRSCVRRKRLRR